MKAIAIILMVGGEGLNLQQLDYVPTALIKYKVAERVAWFLESGHTARSPNLI
jgi:hypothetical protein